MLVDCGHEPVAGEYDRTAVVGSEVCPPKHCNRLCCVVVKVEPVVGALATEAETDVVFTRPQDDTKTEPYTLPVAMGTALGRTAEMQLPTVGIGTLLISVCARAYIDGKSLNWEFTYGTANALGTDKTDGKEPDTAVTDRGEGAEAFRSFVSCMFVIEALREAAGGGGGGGSFCWFDIRVDRLVVLLPKTSA